MPSVRKILRSIDGDESNSIGEELYRRRQRWKPDCHAAASSMGEGAVRTAGDSSFVATCSDEGTCGRVSGIDQARTASRNRAESTSGDCSYPSAPSLCVGASNFLVWRFRWPAWTPLGIARRFAGRRQIPPCSPSGRKLVPPVRFFSRCEKMRMLQGVSRCYLGSGRVIGKKACVRESRDPNGRFTASRKRECP